MAIDDVFGKGDVFKMIVGQERCETSSPGDVPEFEIKPEDVDKVYLMIKKMHRLQSPNPHPYYGKAFANIEEAYLSKSLGGFHSAVRELMEKIDCD